MKTPLKALNNRSGAFSALTKILPDDCVTVHFPFFASGGLELYLCALDKKVVGHTYHWCVEEFWACLKSNPQRLIDNIKFTVGYEYFEEKFFYYMQVNFQTNADIFVRSAQFFALNRCNEDGQIFGGKFVGTKHINDLTYFNMKNLDLHNLSVRMHEESDTINILDSIESDQFIIATPPKFSHRLLPNAQIDTLISPNIDHTVLNDKLKLKDRWVVICDYHPKINELYSNYEIQYFNQNWSMVDKESAEEMIIVKS